MRWTRWQRGEVRQGTPSRRSTLKRERIRRAGREGQGEGGDRLTLLLHTVIDPLHTHDLHAPPVSGSGVFFTLGAETEQVSRHIDLKIFPKLAAVTLDESHDAMPLVCEAMRGRERREREEKRRGREERERGEEREDADLVRVVTQRCSSR
jgi:hypothetical protein